MVFAQKRTRKQQVTMRKGTGKGNHRKRKKDRIQVLWEGGHSGDKVGGTVLSIEKKRGWVWTSKNTGESSGCSRGGGEAKHLERGGY